MTDSYIALPPPGAQLPSYTTTTRNAASFADGAMIYNSTTTAIEVYIGGAWFKAAVVSSP